MPPPAAEVSGPLAPELRFPSSRKQPITWQDLVVPVALAVTADWVILLGYGLAKLVTHALKVAF
jgi:hypothetical protein